MCIRDRFISSVSHELRTPLTAITGWAETIQSGELKDPGDVRKGMDIIVSEAHRLTNMVEELLEFSRIEDGRFTLSVELSLIHISGVRDRPGRRPGRFLCAPQRLPTGGKVSRRRP